MPKHRRQWIRSDWLWTLNRPVSTYELNGSTTASISRPVLGTRDARICCSSIRGRSHRSRRFKQLITSYRRRSMPSVTTQSSMPNTLTIHCTCNGSNLKLFHSKIHIWGVVLGDAVIRWRRSCRRNKPHDVASTSAHLIQLPILLYRRDTCKIGTLGTRQL